ncbi:MAG: 2-deoxy-D-gluconate 3-dehydrogenase, partial [Steroidobacteraceae bacterium]|nr:2-deoxy-D-gluconate 3-dehydrogenase [Steroidobacteraceae bacterium]
GQRFALTLARAGADVVLAARRREPLEATAAEIRALGRQASCVSLDVTDSARVATAFANEIGAVDVLVNNAGTAGPGSLLEMDEETWDRVLDVNVKGAWLVTRAAVRGMIERGSGGSIVNVASVLGVAVQKWTANYPASKAALLQLTRAMALDWARYGIRVNAVVPGYFATEMSAGYLDSEPGQAMLKRMPMRRLGDPAELDGALLLLASDASRYMTGSTITVDGGLSIPYV